MKFRNILSMLILLSGLHVPIVAECQLPEGEGKQIVERVCSQCHSLDDATNVMRTPAQWKYLISMMISLGAPLQDYEVEIVTHYLVNNFSITTDSSTTPDEKLK